MERKETKEELRAKWEAKQRVGNVEEMKDAIKTITKPSPKPKAAFDPQAVVDKGQNQAKRNVFNTKGEDTSIKKNTKQPDELKSRLGKRTGIHIIQQGKGINNNGAFKGQ